MKTLDLQSLDRFGIILIYGNPENSHEFGHFPISWTVKSGFAWPFKSNKQIIDQSIDTVYLGQRTGDGSFPTIHYIADVDSTVSPDDIRDIFTDQQWDCICEKAPKFFFKLSNIRVTEPFKVDVGGKQNLTRYVNRESQNARIINQDKFQSALDEMKKDMEHARKFLASVNHDLGYKITLSNAKMALAEFAQILSMVTDTIAEDQLRKMAIAILQKLSYSR